MCGFTVCIRASGLRPQDLEALERCNAGMHYRGPDGHGVWHDDQVGLAHVRLAIIGVSNGSQPIFSADGRFVLVCNGEIYNHRLLREELRQHGAEFTTLSDCEVIIHAYHIYGDDFLTRLDGMFAFVLYDREQGRVVAARDRAGKKPLYRHDTADVVVLSSEHKAIAREFLQGEATLDYEVIRQVQLHRYSISERSTYVREILKVPPGHRLDVTIGHPPRESAWTTRHITPAFAGSYEQAVSDTRDLLFRAVENRLESEVPLALLLSAGIDSSAIACICRALDRPVQTFSAGYARRSASDESTDAERLARDLGLPFERVVLDEARFVDDLGAILPLLDEPNGDPSMFSQWALYREIHARCFTVLLSGIGGDEVFYGYPQRNGGSPQASLQRPGKLRKLYALTRTIAQRPARETAELLDFMLRQIARNRSLFRKPVLDAVARQNASSRAAPLNIEDMADAGLQATLDRTYSSLVRSYLPNNGFFLADKLAMAHSIEVRSPFADQQLREYVDQLPLEYKFPRNEAKGLLKDALRGVVPEHVLQRRKTGFTPPSRYVLATVDCYRNRFFGERTSSLAQIATDYYCAEMNSRSRLARFEASELVDGEAEPVGTAEY